MEAATGVVCVHTIDGMAPSSFTIECFTAMAAEGVACAAAILEGGCSKLCRLPIHILKLTQFALEIS
jgi:hypothetical protein